MKLGASLSPPQPIARADADDLLSAGDDQTLMERVVALCAAPPRAPTCSSSRACAPEPGMVHATRVNALMLKALDAELVLVGSPRGETPAELANAIAIAARGYGGSTRAAGALLPEPRRRTRRRRAPASRGHRRGGRTRRSRRRTSPPTAPRSRREKLRPVAIVPSRADLAAPRVKDLARRGRRAGAPRRRLRAPPHPHVALCAMTVPESIKAFRAGHARHHARRPRATSWSPPRSRCSSGMPLAGLLLTGGRRARRARPRALRRRRSRPGCRSSR